MLIMAEQEALKTSGRRGRGWTARALLAAAAMLTATLTPVATATATRTAAAPQLPDCQQLSSGRALLITDTCNDPLLKQPFLDVQDQSGSVTDPTTGVTVSYDYFHGYFLDNPAVKFSFYFPQGTYQGRFFEPTYPTNTQEDLTQDCSPVTTSACAVVFAISHGAYVVSTNNAGGVQTQSVLAAYRANAAAAKYSRIVAEQLYDTSQRPRGYIYGASGGAYQTVGAMENTSGVWDGAAPQVFGVPNAIPSFMTVELLVLRVLGDKLARVAAALEPGGNGNPYAGLNSQQRAVLQEATRLGFPLRGWWQWATLTGGAFLATEIPVRLIDSCYGPNTNPGCASTDGDFWTDPGYEGSERAVRAARIQYDTSVVSLAGASGLVLSNVPAGDLSGADLIITSGPLADITFVPGLPPGAVPITAVSGNTVQLAFNPGITPGTAVRLDNSWLIALQYYQRHQVPTPDEYAWNQYRRDGVPIPAQRGGTCTTPIGPGLPAGLRACLLTGPILAGSTGGSVANGQFHGKMIMLGSTMDVQAYPWSEDWYRNQAQAFLGANLNNQFRLWYMDNADHDPNGPAATNAANAADHIVPYSGEVQQALLDLDAWVAQGIQPPASTNYTVGADTGIQLPATAPQRQGVQPVVTLSASKNGKPKQSINVAAGQPVTFSVEAQVPPGTGKIVQVEWDFEGVGSFAVPSPLTQIGPVLNLDATHTFTQPGTYFPVVRVTSQRDGDTSTPYSLIQNLARVRVVVH
jgi:hypothetical protein